MHTSLRISLTACFLACCSALLAGTATRSSKPRPDRVEKLIEQLDNDEFDKREEAMEKLVDIGEQTMPILKRALENKDISLEAASRIRYLLGSLSGPEHGVVWRTLISPGMHHHEKAQVPEGLLPGDVITEIDGKSIDSDEAASRFRGRWFECTGQDMAQG